jgi:predicted AlkP superfamily phosphohydrolase/phosphomutase
MKRHNFSPPSRISPLISLLLLQFLLGPSVAFAYIGPGAGFAFLGSAFVFILTLGLAALTILFWPLQWLLRKVCGKGVPRSARFRRVVIVGLDGLEPSLTDRYMAEGAMPNLQALGAEGSYVRLKTTLPALSPVAWSSFQTGVNPGAHNIFDFLTRDKRNYFPVMASTEIAERVRSFGLGFLSWKRKTSEVVITRKSEPFWRILGRKGIFANVIRVPISYPPEECYGNVLSAMCTPDLKGTQGSFTLFKSGTAAGAKEATGGQERRFAMNGALLEGSIEGPPEADGSFVLVGFNLEKNGSEQATLQVSAEKVNLELNQFSDWVRLNFRSKAGKEISGIARFCLRALEPEVILYISPVNVDPEKPALPIAKPIYFASWLARRLGLFGTLGLMEDTWGRNELALDDQRFLDQTYLTHNERERMLFEVLDKTREGLCICVFDASDRIQHMFWRYLDPKHPSPLEDASMANVIPDMYKRMDALIGRVRKTLSKKDLLLVMSDHGFASFRRCVNINSWLRQEGYLVLKDGKKVGADYLKDVDWSKTKAFAIGLSGLYLNRKGREKQGIVEAKDAENLRLEISQKLEALCDPQDGSAAVSRVYDTAKHYKGLYAREAPDLVVGYNPGYRVSWESVTGAVEAEVFSDNVKAWSGDHHVDPVKVPGVLFSSSPLTVTDPHIVDIAPTVLKLFKVKVPSYMEGQTIL